jgi:hypothetical protein
MDEFLASVVEQIGRLADKAEENRWEVARAVSDAYQELPAYSRGLTAGLCTRMKRSSDQVYNLRYAWDFRSLLVVSETTLSVSHFASLYHLKEKYNLTDDECREWIEWAQENNIHVRELSEEISAKYCSDARKMFFKRVLRVQKDIQRLWEDMETIGFPDEIRAVTKAALKVLQDWVTALLDWRG